MTKNQPKPGAQGEESVLDMVTQGARDISEADGFKAKMYQAISVQRPVVLEYLKSVRRDNPDATPEHILKELDRRYVRTVTVASTGVGASAAIPAVGIPVALGLGVADLLFFYETSALYVLAVSELHGIEVADAERAQPLVLGMLLGQKSQSKISKLVMQASGAGSVNVARSVAAGSMGKALPKGWGEVLTQQLPDSALAPLATVIAREALKAGGKVGARTAGKVLPFGVGAVLGGVGSYTFGRDVVKAARIAFPTPPTAFPDSLAEYQKPAPGTQEPSRAMKALQSAADHLPDKDQALTVVKRAGSAVRGAGTAAKSAGSAVKDAAVSGADAVGSRFKRKD